MKNGTISKVIGGLAAGAIGTMFIINCGSDGTPVGATPNGGGTTSTAGTITLNGGGVVSGGGGTTSTTTTPTTTDNCGAQEGNLAKQAADLLIVLDASTSMARDIAGTTDCAGGDTCKQRWATVTTALSTVLSAPIASGIDWGLKFFATSINCVVSATMEVPLAANTAATIKQQIATKQLINNTPTRKAIELATAYLKTVSNNHKKSILLATDGEPNCKGTTANTTSDVPETIKAIAAAAAAGFNVYVIGIGPETGNLKDFAVAGGTNDYFPATTPETLSSALQTVAGQVASCTFTLSKAPPDLNNIGVYLEKDQIPKDGTNGWTYGAGNTSVVFNGSVCEGIKAGNGKAIRVFFGCPGVDVPKVIP